MNTATRFAAIERVDPGDVVGGQLHPRGLEVRDDALGRHGLGDDHEALGEVPRDDHLGRRRAADLGDLRDHGIGEEVAALTERGPGLVDDAVAALDLAHADHVAGARRARNQRFERRQLNTLD